MRTRLSERDIFWWNDVAYLGNHDIVPGELELLDLKASVCKKARMGASEFVPETFKRGMESEQDDLHHDSDHLFLSNESFLIDVRYVHLTVSSHRRASLCDIFP